MAGYYQYGTASRPSPARYPAKQTPQQLAAAQRDAAMRGTPSMKPPSFTARQAAQSPQQISALRDQFMSINPDSYAGTPQYDSQMAARNQAYVNYGNAMAVANPASWYHTNLRTTDANAMAAYNQQMGQQAYNQMQLGQPVTAQMMNAIHSDPFTSQMYQWNQLPQIPYGAIRPGMGGSWQPAAAGDENAWMSNPAYMQMR